MKQRFFTPAIAATIVAFSLFSCAGTSETTAMDETTSMSETQTMAGVTEEEMEAETAPELSFTDDEDYNEMFDNIADTKQYDLISLAKTSPNLSTFATLVETAGIADAITAEGKFTIFAPTNKAFSSMPKAELERLMKPENKAELIKVLQLHILPNEVASVRFKDNQRIKAGEDRYINVRVNSTTNEVAVGGANIVHPDVSASNGVLHVIDGVIATTSGTAR